MKTLSKKIQFQCPDCRASLQVRAYTVGRRIQCHTCRAVVRVPGSRVRAPSTSSTPRTSEERVKGDAHRTPCLKCGKSILLTAPRCKHCMSWVESEEESKEERQLLVRNIAAILTLVVVCIRVAVVLA
ncbi:MAG: hypothetical protein JKY65_05190 [Planctomycetes bacterium]|nr:hypothetical protein [Planctomycetota bacterium]